jgi:hypothetical protein
LDENVLNFQFVGVLADVLVTFPKIGRFSFQSSGHSGLEFDFMKYELQKCK